MLLDSNIIIYAAQAPYRRVREFIAREAPHVSVISYVEVVGYYRLSDVARRYFRRFFDAAPMLPITQAVIEEATRLRQQRKVSLGDALIAATALDHKLTLITHNTKDFEWIENLVVYDPLSQE